MENKNNPPNHEANTLSEFVDFTFPKITGKVAPKLLSDTIATLEEMGLTEKQIIKGRIVKPYPEKYDDFNTTDDLLEFIGNEIYTHSDLKWDWLKASSYSTMRFQSRTGIYYTPVMSIGVSCWEPRTEHTRAQNRKGKDLLRLNPNKWGYDLVEEIIEKIKNENQ